MTEDAVSGPAGEYEAQMSCAMAGMPADLAAAILRGIDRAARRTGYVAVFREETGLGTLYFRRPKGHRPASVPGTFEADG